MEYAVPKYRLGCFTVAGQVFAVHDDQTWTPSFRLQPHETRVCCIENCFVSTGRSTCEGKSMILVAKRTAPADNLDGAYLGRTLHFLRPQPSCRVVARYQQVFLSDANWLAS